MAIDKHSGAQELYSPSTSVSEVEVLAALSPSPEDQAQLSLRFRALGKAAIASGEASERHVAQTIRVAEWMYFTPEEPLPPELVWVEDALGRKRIGFHPERYSEGDFRVGRQDLGISGLGPILRELDIPAGRVVEVQQVAEAYAKDTPAGKLLRSFMTPRDEMHDVPLSPTMRLSRKAQVEDAARRKVQGVDPALLIRNTANNPIAADVYRAGLTLDEATMREKRPDLADQTPLFRMQHFCRDWLTKTLVAHYGCSEDSQVGAIVSSGSKAIALRMIDVRTGEAHAQIVPASALFDAAYTLAKEISPNSTSFEHFVSETMFAVMFDLALQYDTPIEKIIEKSLYQGGAAIVTAHKQGVWTNPVGDAIQGMRDVPGELMPKDEYELRRDRENVQLAAAHRETADVQNLSAEKLQLHERIEIANVTLRPTDDHAPRMVIAAPRTAVPRESSLQPDLQLELHAAAAHVWNDANPSIPGYELITRKGNVCGFVRSAHDPYAPTGQKLSRRNRRALARKYHQVQLDGLADAMTWKRSLSFDDLTTLLRVATEYPKFSVEQLKEMGLPESVTISDWQDLNQLVKDGQMYLQCTGAASLHALSSKEIFGAKAATAVISGHRIRPDGRVTLLAHDQVRNKIHGKDYITDSTPHVKNERPITAPVFDDREEVAEDTLVQAEVALVGIEKTSALSARAKPLRASAETHLRAALGADNNDKLYRIIQNLPQGDPVLKAMQTLARATKGRISQQEITANLQFMENYINTPPTKLGGRKMAEYDPELLVTLWQLVSALA